MNSGETYSVPAVTRDRVCVRETCHDTQTHRDTWITWSDLRRAASQASCPLDRDRRGFQARGNGGYELAKFYRGILAQAERELNGMPSKANVYVGSNTGGATYFCYVDIVAGSGGRGVFMNSDEGMDHPHRSMAVAEAREIRDRLRRRGLLAEATQPGDFISRTD